MIRNLFGGTSAKCRTVDVCDIFGDNSGKALYRLDGNANDESGNYHGTEVGSLVYGGGVYERGAKLANGGTYIKTSGILTGMTDFTMSVWLYPTAYFSGVMIPIYAQQSAPTTGAGIYITWRNDASAGFNVTGSFGSTIIVTPNNAVPLNTWTHCTISRQGTTFKAVVNSANTYTATGASTAIDANNAYSGIGFYTTSITADCIFDQMRIFNRAITAPEVATLYAECEPTSTIDNINPFMDGSLKALYQFNGDATDKTGTYNGTATNVTYSSGKFGQCAVFNGTDTKVVTSYQAWASVNMSLSFWIKFTSTSLSIMPIGNTAGSTASYMQPSNFVGRLAYYSNSNTVLCEDTTARNDGTWHYFVIVQTSTNTKMYVNGTLVSTGGANTTSTTPIQFGARASSFYFPGSLDQLRIFNKALTPMEVASLYNETTPLEEPMRSLVDPFKDGSGKALYRLDGNSLDESGNYNGTATSVTYGAGQFGRCGVFNGSTSQVTLPSTLNNASIPFTTAQSVSFWFNTTATTNMSILGIGSCLFSKELNGVFWATTVNTSGNATTVTLGTQSALSNGAWHHVVISNNGSSTSVYLNGNFSGTQTTYGAGGFTQNTTLGFGFTISSYNRYNGNLDQVRIFNRALTAGEVSTLYTEI